MADVKHTPPSKAFSASALAHVMARAGWEINYVDLDLTGDKPQAEIKLVRHDGLWVWAKVDHVGRAYVERFQREKWLGMSGNGKGRRPLSPQVKDVFLGRSSYTGPRSMLRNLTAYLSDNSLQPIAIADMRAAWASVMGAPMLLGHEAAKATVGAARATEGSV